MGQREQAHVGVPGERSRLGGGRVAGLHGALALLRGERRLVDEHVGLVRRDGDRVARARVSRDDDLAP